jgi:hypothetical protein
MPIARVSGGEVRGRGRERGVEVDFSVEEKGAARLNWRVHRGLPAAAGLLLLGWACSPGAPSKPPPGGTPDAGTPLPQSALGLSTTEVDFGLVASGLTRTQTVALSNLSDRDLDLEITAESTDPEALGLSPSGPLHLAAHEAMTLVATFAPPAGSNETYQATFELSYCAPGCVEHLALSGVATATCLGLDLSSLDFGFAVGEKGITISNHCDQAYALAADPILSSTEPGAFRLATDTPVNGAEIPANGYLWIGVVFVPSNAQEYDGLLTLVLADPDSRELGVRLTGFGGGGPRASCAPAAIDFGPNAVGISSTLSISCTNVGADVYGHPETELFMLPHSDNPSFVACVLDPGTGKCILPDGGGIHPGETAFLDVSYAPSAPGIESAQLTLFTDGLDPQPVVTLNGSAEAIPACDSRITNPLLEFGRVSPGNSALLWFSIANLGRADCLLDGLRLTPDDASAAAGVAPPFSLPQARVWYRIAPGKEVTVQVEFAPPDSTAVGPNFSGQVEFSLSDPSNPHWVVPLTGRSW